LVCVRGVPCVTLLRELHKGLSGREPIPAGGSSYLRACRSTLEVAPLPYTYGTPYFPSWAISDSGLRLFPLGVRAR
jgi:hypothetical protein